MLPGGFGTLDEIFETATLVQTGKIKDFPIVLMGRDYWQPLVEFLRSRPLAAGTIGPEDVERLVVTDSPVEVARSVADTAMRRFGLTYGPQGQAALVSRRAVTRYARGTPHLREP